MRLLPFQQSIQNDINNSKSCLIILSKGLGTFNIIYNYLSKLEINTGNTIFIINLSLSEVECFKLFALNMDNKQSDDSSGKIMNNNSLLSNKLVVINSEMNLNKRKEFYCKGGICIITSRILLTDLLSERLDVRNIDGMIVFNAESLNVRNWNDAFILQLYKSKNPNGFIKGLSQRPEILNQGYFGPGIAMRYLGTTDLFLYPRSHVTVEGSLKLSREIKVIEKAVKATKHFYIIQKCIKILLEKGLHEILKLDSNVEVTVCDLLYNSSKKLKNKIESLTQDLWFKMTSKLKQIAKDIISMRNLLDLLYILDASEFFFCLEYIRSSKLIDPSWMLTTEFEALYKASRSRVFSVNCGKNINNSGSENPFSLCLEVNPIYIQLFDVILNIGKELTKEDVSILIQENNSYHFPSIKKEQTVLDLDYSCKNINSQIYNETIYEELDENENDSDKLEAFRIKEQSVEIHSKILGNNFTLTQQLAEYRVLIVPDDLYLTTTEIELLLFKSPQYLSIMKLIEIFQNIESDLAFNQSNIISKVIPFFGASINLSSNEKSHSLNQLRLILSKLIQNSGDNKHSYSSKDTVIHSIQNTNIPENSCLDEITKNCGISPKIIITYPNVNVQGMLCFEYFFFVLLISFRKILEHSFIIFTTFNYYVGP